MRPITKNGSLSALTHRPLLHRSRTPPPGLDGLILNLPRVSGRWPKAGGKGLLVFACCDSDALQAHGLPFARSLDRNSPGCHLHLHLLNPVPYSRRLLEELETELSDTNLSHTAEHFDFQTLPAEFARAYREGIRFVRLYELVCATQRDALALEVNALVRGNLQSLREAVRAEHQDCAVQVSTNGLTARKRFATGVFYVAPTALGRVFLAGAAARIAQPLVKRKAHDSLVQTAFHETHRARRRLGVPLRLHSIPEGFADRRFHKRAAIWMDGESARANDTYLAHRAVFAPERHAPAPPATLRGVRPRVVILLPRLDLPFKDPGGVLGLIRRVRRRLRPERWLRAPWREFVEAAATAFERHGCDVEIVTHALSRMSSELVNELHADIVLVPHKQHFQFEGLNCQPLFYMQVTFPWLFTVDRLGWSAASSTYPCDYGAGDPERGTFERYVEQIVAANVSKFRQTPRIERERLVSRGEIPEGPYIFFPCQQAADQAIRFFSPHEVIDVVGALARWAEAREVPVVFKAHPEEVGGARPLRRVARGAHVYWSSASIHDLIPASAAVYVINSGVGFEALLHDKPVVTFGRVEYDAVTVSGDLNDLDATWEAVSGWDAAARRRAYRRFVDWYCRLYCVDLTSPETRDVRLDAVVAETLAGAGVDRPAGAGIDRN